MKAKSKAPFQVGELVTCSFANPSVYGGPSGVIRHVTAVHWSGDVLAAKVGCTGWLVSADGGDPCPHCGSSLAPVPLVDSGYYSRYVKS